MGVIDPWQLLPKMTAQEMCSIIDQTEPGHQLEVIFANKAQKEDNREFARKLFQIIAMLDKSFTIEEHITLRFGEALESGIWSGAHTFTLEILDGFDPDVFIKRTVDCGMIESVSRIV